MKVAVWCGAGAANQTVGQIYEFRWFCESKSIVRSLVADQWAGRPTAHCRTGEAILENSLKQSLKNTWFNQFGYKFSFLLLSFGRLIALTVLSLCSSVQSALAVLIGQCWWICCVWVWDLNFAVYSAFCRTLAGERPFSCFRCVSLTLYHCKLDYQCFPPFFASLHGIENTATRTASLGNCRVEGRLQFTLLNFQFFFIRIFGEERKRFRCPPTPAALASSLFWRENRLIY